MNKKLIAIGILGTTITGFILPVSSFATTLQEHFDKFQVNKKTDEVLKLIKESQYSDTQKERLTKAVKDISMLESTKTIDEKINILQDSMKQVFYEMSKEDIATYVKDDCTSYTMNLVIHSVMTFQNDNHLELQGKPDLLFSIFKTLVDTEKTNEFNKSYIQGVYDTVNDYTYLTTTDFSKWKELKKVSDDFYNPQQPTDVIKDFPINLKNTEYINKTTFDDSTKKQFLDVHKSFETSAVKVNKENVKKTIDEFLKVRVTKGTWSCLSRYDTVSKQYNAIDFLINKLDKKDKVELIKYFDTEMTDLYASSKRDTTMCFKSCLDDLENKYKSDSELMDTIVENGLKVFKYNNQHDGEDNEGAVDIKGNHEDGRIDNGYLPGWKPWKPNPQENLPMPKIYIKNVEYQNINGRCYKVVITKDINNKVVKREKFKAQGTYCGLIDDSQNSSIYSGVATAMGSSDWYSVNKDGNDDSDLSNKSFYYKLSDSLEYINTGINVHKNMTLTYDQMKNLLYEIGLKAGYQFMDDTDKFLIVVDGNPYVIKNSQKEFKIEDVDKIFNNAVKVKLKLMTEDEAKELNQKYKLNIEKVTGFHVNGKTVSFEKKPFVSNSAVLVPIEEISKELGINVTKENGNYVFKKDNSIVTIQPQNNQIVANGSAIALSSTPTVQDNCLFMESKDFLSAFNYKSDLNPENGLFEIS